MSLCQKNSIKTLCSYVFMSKKQHKGSILFCFRVYASTGSSFYFLFLTFFFLLCKSIAFTA